MPHSMTNSWYLTGTMQMEKNQSKTVEHCKQASKTSVMSCIHFTYLNIAFIFVFLPAFVSFGPLYDLPHPFALACFLFVSIQSLASEMLALQLKILSISSNLRMARSFAMQLTVLLVSNVYFVRGLMMDKNKLILQLTLMLYKLLYKNALNKFYFLILMTL